MKSILFLMFAMFLIVCMWRLIDPIGSYGRFKKMQATTAINANRVKISEQQVETAVIKTATAQEERLNAQLRMS